MNVQPASLTGAAVDDRSTPPRVVGRRAVVAAARGHDEEGGGADAAASSRRRSKRRAAGESRRMTPDVRRLPSAAEAMRHPMSSGANLDAERRGNEQEGPEPSGFGPFQMCGRAAEI